MLGRAALLVPVGTHQVAEEPAMAWHLQVQQLVHDDLSVEACGLVEEVLVGYLKLSRFCGQAIP